MAAIDTFGVWLRKRSSRDEQTKEHFLTLVEALYERAHNPESRRNLWLGRLDPGLRTSLEEQYLWYCPSEITVVTPNEAKELTGENALPKLMKRMASKIERASNIRLLMTSEKEEAKQNLAPITKAMFESLRNTLYESSVGSEKLGVAIYPALQMLLEVVTISLILPETEDEDLTVLCRPLRSWLRKVPVLGVNNRGEVIVLVCGGQ